ncbi:MAG: DNA alkylation repair protein, partial [Anaerolineae bacterium]
FEKTPFAYQKAVEWSERAEEYVKRAGFVLMARLAVSDKKSADERFAAFFPLIEREAGDSRDMVKKGVNWALRQIGKRNLALNRLAISVGKRIQQQESKAAQWVARDALKELQGTAVQNRLKN